jgi:hypothetical protein
MKNLTEEGKMSVRRSGGQAAQQQRHRQLSNVLANKSTTNMYPFVFIFRKWKTFLIESGRSFAALS